MRHDTSVLRINKASYNKLCFCYSSSSSLHVVAIVLLPSRIPPPFLPIVKLTVNIQWNAPFLFKEKYYIETIMLVFWRIFNAIPVDICQINTFTITSMTNIFESI